MSTATTMVNNENEDNQLLLNAIKNKFAAQTANEAAAFSPPKFNIPLLKIPDSASLKNLKANDSTNGTEQQQQCTSKSTPQLNQFLLKQLQEKYIDNNLTGESSSFVIPKVQFANKLQNSNQIATTNSNIASLTTDIHKLHVRENAPEPNRTTPAVTPVIDLSTALSLKSQTRPAIPPTRDFIKCENLENDDDINFDIPFIECDRLEDSSRHKIFLTNTNEYCVTDISKLTLKHSLVEPSSIGRILNIDDNKYSAPLPLKCLSDKSQPKSVKHDIVPFLFDTKSPDDLVLVALNKYQKLHHN